MHDYNDYWRSVDDEVAAADSDWDRVPQGRLVAAHGRHWRLDWIRYSSVGNRLIWGWYCVPDDHSIDRNAVLWLPGYSYGTSPPDANSLTPGACVMSINVHGNQPNAPYVNPSGKDDYICNGIEAPERSIFRSIAGHSLRALDVLARQPEIDSERLVTAGMSQGAMLALMVAAQRREVRVCFADMPFLSDFRHALRSGRTGVYRAMQAYIGDNKERESAVIDTMTMFDPVSHASRITCPVWLSAGGRDPGVKPRAVEAVYNQLASTYKVYRLFADAGHVFVPEMTQTRERWIREFLPVT